MEFRVFLPLLNASDRDWIKQTNHDSRNLIFLDVYQSLTEFWLNSLNSSRSVEERMDQYINDESSSSCHFGLKYRSEDKLELKLLMQQASPQDFFIEIWEKIKYGKKGLDHYREKVLESIRKSPFHNHSSIVADDILSPISSYLVSVNKRRVNTQIGNISMEICQLQLQVNSSLIPLTDRQWISICVEGANTDSIKSFLINSSQIEMMWKMLKYLSDLQNILGTTTLRDHQFYPILGGYPGWIKALRNQLTDDVIDQHFKNLRFIIDLKDATTVTK